MANGRKSFLDLFRMDDDDDNYDEDDDIFDEDDADEYEPAIRPKKPKKQKPPKRPAEPKPQPVEKPQYRQPQQKSSYQPSYQDRPSYSPKPQYAAPEKPAPAPAPAPAPKRERRFGRDNLVSFDSYERKNVPPSNEVYVIRPMEFDDAQTVADFLKKGRATVINMEGLQVESAQRIIDFIGGACYGLEGELKAISANIFIAVPANMEVSGDLRDEILSQTFGTPSL